MQIHINTSVQLQLMPSILKSLPTCTSLNQFVAQTGLVKYAYIIVLNMKMDFQLNTDIVPSLSIKGMCNFFIALLQTHFSDFDIPHIVGKIFLYFVLYTILFKISMELSYVNVRTRSR